MFTIASQSPDIINSSGTLSATNAYTYRVAASSYTEGANPAYVRYYVCFYRADVYEDYQYVDFNYTLYVGGNTWWTNVS